MENIKKSDKINFERVECDKTRKMNDRKSTARRYLRLNSVVEPPGYFTHKMDDYDDQLGGGKSRSKRRSKRKRRKRKSRKLC